MLQVGVRLVKVLAVNCQYPREIDHLIDLEKLVETVMLVVENKHEEK